jgi:hypothetical protein
MVSAFSELGFANRDYHVFAAGMAFILLCFTGH